MEQSDLDLLQTVPIYHLQSVLKTRRLSISLQTLTGSSLVSNPTAQLTPAAAQELARHLFASNAITEALSQSGELDMAILRELVACGGRANSRDLAFYFSCTGLLETRRKSEPLAVSEEADDLVRPTLSTTSMPLQPPQYPPAHPHGVFEQALRRLLMLGLLFWGRQPILASRDYTSGTHDGVLAVPVAVRDAVRQRWSLDEKPLLTFAADDVGEGARALQRSLYLYWSFAMEQREGLPLVNNGLLARSALRQVVEQIERQEAHESVRTERDFPRLLFVRFLLMKLGLLQERQNALYAVSAAAEKYFALPLLERVRRCYTLYLETPFWSEMPYLPEVNVRPGPLPLDPAHEEVVRARRMVLERLEYEQAEGWHDLPAFIARTRLHIPYLLFPRQYGPRSERYSSGSNPYGWDFRLRRGWLTHREGWHMVEGGFIRAIVGGPLCWLGIVELDREENPTTFQFCAGAAVIMGSKSPTGEQEHWGRLIVQPNFELVALAPVSEALLVRLDRFAERIGLEHIAQYRVTRASVTRAIQKGWQAEEIVRVLEQAAGVGIDNIPQNVRYSLAEWERQARRVELWPNMTLLEVDDEGVLDMLFANTDAHTLFGRRLSPRLAEILPQHIATVQELLWQQQFLPALSPAENGQVQHEPQWYLREDGMLDPCYPVLDLYLVAEMSSFCERAEETGIFRVTEESLKRALAQGTELTAIIRFLQRYCADGIPPSLLIRLKLWGSGYENFEAIEIEHAPLLRLPTSVLQDLQNDGEVASLLGSEVEQAYKLVRVQPEDLERVVELLKARGFVVE